MKSASFFSRSLSTVIAIAASGFLFSACGGLNTNPVSDYQDLKAAKVPPPIKQAEYRVHMPQLWVITPDPIERIPNFVEGVESEFIFNSRTTDPSIVYSLTILNLPKDASFLPLNDPKRPGAFSLLWKPALGTLRKSDNGKRNIVFQIRVDIINAGRPEIANLVQEENGQLRNFMLVVNATQMDPQINSIKLASPQVVVGDADAITVEVVDPASTSENPPTLQIAEDGDVAAAAGIQKIAKFVKFDAPTFAGGTFTFTGKLDSSSVNLPKGKSEVTGRFNLRAVSSAVGSAASAWQSVDVLIDQKPAPVASPTPTPDQKSDQKSDQKPGANPVTDQQPGQKGALK